MASDDSNNEGLQPRKPSPFGWFTVTFGPPLLLMGTALPLYSIEDPTPLQAVLPHIAFGGSILYLVIQLAMIFYRGKPMYMD